MIQRASADDKFRLFQTGATITTNSAISDDTPVIIGAVRTSSTSRMYVNATVQTATTSTAADLTNSAVKLGSESGQFGSWSGRIYEVVVGRGTLDDNQRQKIEGYLAHRYGLQTNLPTDHPYYSAKPIYKVQQAFTSGLLDGGLIK